MWRPDSSSIITVEGSEVLLYRIPGGSLLGKWRADGYTLSSYSLVRTAWSPDRQRVLIVGQDSQGRNALFVITVP